MAVEIGARRLAEARGQRLLRDLGEIHDVPRRVVERDVVDRGAVLDRRADLADVLDRRSVGLDDGVAFREEQAIVFVEILGVLVPRLEAAVLERHAAAVHHHEHLVVPGRAIGGEDDRHRGALVALVLRDAEENLTRSPRLREHEIRTVGEVLLVVADLREIAVDRPVEADVDPVHSAPVDGHIGFLHQAGCRADSMAFHLAWRQQRIVARSVQRRGKNGSENHRIGDCDPGAFRKNSGILNVNSALLTLSIA